MCNPDSQMCECEAGWVGDDCSGAACQNVRPHPKTALEPVRLASVAPDLRGTQQPCARVQPSRSLVHVRAAPQDCSGRGMCVDGCCYCPPGFEGKDCSVRACPNRCSMHGACLPSGACACFDG